MDTIQILNNFTEDTNYIIGNVSLEFLISAFLFFFLGTILVKLLRLSRRNKNKEHLETKEFSWSYWFNDNWITISISFIIGFLSIRFTSDLVHVLENKIPFLNGNDPMWVYIIFGLFQQSIIDFFQKQLRPEKD